MTQIDFKTAVPAAQAGDKAAQDILMSAFYAWSVSEVRRIVRDSERAKDIAVDFWTWMFREKGVLEYDAAKGAFYPWMTNALRYRALERTKQEPKLIYTSEVNNPESWDTAPDPSERLSALQDLEAVAKAMRSAQHKDVFWRLIEGATADEIALEIGVSVKRARNLIGEVRAVIQAHIGADND
jgi:DNA-directed RNA polymerase specialized sigma24 family protein